MRSGTPSWMIFSCCGRELRERHVDGKVVVFGQCEQFFELVGVGGRVPGGDGAVANGFGFVGDDAVHVGGDDVAEAFALGASASGRLKSKSCGSGSGKSRPQVSQRREVLKVRRRQVRSSIGMVPLGSAMKMTQEPSPAAKAVSSDSRRRSGVVEPVVRRSRMMVMRVPGGTFEARVGANDSVRSPMIARM